jgi:hypothetical protein
VPPPYPHQISDVAAQSRPIPSIIGRDLVLTVELSVLRFSRLIRSKPDERHDRHFIIYMIFNINIRLGLSNFRFPLASISSGGGSVGRVEEVDTFLGISVPTCLEYPDC